MSTAVWPPVSPEDLIKEEQASLERELNWFLDSLRETLQSLKAGLEECAALLAPSEHGSTLVVSTHRSEALKGFITRTGTRIVKGNVQLKLPSLPPPRGSTSYPLVVSSAPQAPTLVLSQLTSVRNCVNNCLDVTDATMWTGDSKNASFIAGQLLLLDENIKEAQQALKGGDVATKHWNEDSADAHVFDPPLPSQLSVHLSILDAALLLEVRTLEPAPSTPTNTSGFGIRSAFAAALGGSRQPAHDEANNVFSYRGHDVRVKEKVRVESQDPSLIAAMIKLNALEHSIALSREALRIVMGKEEAD